jgi:hypothetical protein
MSNKPIFLTSLTSSSTGHHSTFPQGQKIKHVLLMNAQTQSRHRLKATIALMNTTQEKIRRAKSDMLSATGHRMCYHQQHSW